MTAAAAAVVHITAVEDKAVVASSSLIHFAVRLMETVAVEDLVAVVGFRLSQ